MVLDCIVQPKDYDLQKILGFCSWLQTESEIMVQIRIWYFSGQLNTGSNPTAHHKLIAWF